MEQVTNIRKAFGGRACGSYRGIKQVEEYNPRKFIIDFYRVRKVLVYAATTNIYVEAKRQDVWALAKKNVINYRIDTLVYPGKTVMVIL